MVTKFFSAKIAKQVALAVRNREERRWNNGEYSIEYRPAQISFSTDDRFGGTGTCIRLENFLNGEMHNFVTEYFAPGVLDEVISSAKELLQIK